MDQGKRCTLDRALSKLGICSRTEAEKKIRAGKVSVDGRICKDASRFVTLGSTRIEVEGLAEESKAKRPPERRVILLHKTKGLVTTRSDERGRKTVYSLLTENERTLHPVGRLDQATTGLLLFTNDTEFSAKLTDPKNSIPRVYLVTVRGEFTEEKGAKLRSGIQDRGEQLRAERIEIRKASGRETHLIVTLVSGKNREIRRLFKAMGHEVTALKRVEFGGLKLGTLPPGRFREVSEGELRANFCEFL